MFSIFVLQTSYHQIQTSEPYSIVSLSTQYALWQSQDKSFDFSLKSKVCNMESNSLIFPSLSYEKQFF